MDEPVDLSTALVIFTASPRQMASLDVAVGPCVAAAGRKHPLVRPTRQDYIRFEHVRALFGVLVGGHLDAAFAVERATGEGRLATFAPGFSAALGRLFVEGKAQAEAAERSSGRVEMPERYRDVSARWGAVAWSAWRGEFDGLVAYLAVWGDKARRAREQNWELYAWQGPAVPIWGLASGVGAESYEQYRRGSGR
jgi:hypothetical protein